MSDNNVSPLPPAAAVLFNVVDQMLEGLQIIDKHWRYVYVNEVVAKQGKQTKERLLGKTMMECYPGIENTSLFVACKKTMDEGVSTHIENEFEYPDGSKGNFELMIHPVDGGGILILSIDITSRKFIENELKQKIREVELLFSSTVDRESRMEELKHEMAELRELSEQKH